MRNSGTVESVDEICRKSCGEYCTIVHNLLGVAEFAIIVVISSSQFSGGTE